MTDLEDRQDQLAAFLTTGWPKFKLQPLPLLSACAAVGNATQENLCRPLTPGEKDHGSDGLFQWRLERLRAMQSWTYNHFSTWQTIEAQAAFFVYELQTQYPALYSELMAGLKPIETLTANICNAYERPAPAAAALDNRIAAARSTYDRLVRKGISAPGSVPPAGPPVSDGPSASGDALVTAWRQAKKSVSILEQSLQDARAKEAIAKQALDTYLSTLHEEIGK